MMYPYLRPIASTIYFEFLRAYLYVGGARVRRQGHEFFLSVRKLGIYRIQQAFLASVLLGGLDPSFRKSI